MGVIIKQGIQNTIISYAGALLGFVNKLFLLPKLFLVQQVGLINVMGSIALLYAQFSSFGLYQITVKYFPFYKNHKKGDFLTLVLFWMLVGFVFVSIVFVLLEDLIRGNYLKNSPLLQDYYYWLMPLAFFVLLTEVLMSYCRALLKSVITSFTKDILLRIFILIGVVLYYLDAINFDFFVKYFVYCHAFTAIVLLVFLIKYKHVQLSKISIPFSTVKEYLSFGFFLTLSGASNILIANIDAFMLASYTGLEDVGVYTTMGYLVSAMLIPYKGIYKIASPMVPIYWKSNALDQVQKLYTQFSLSAFFITATLFLLILVNHDLLFIWLNKSYESGFYIFIFIGVARLVDVMYGINTVILLTSHKYKIDLLFNGILVVLTVVSNMIFIPQYGMQGAVFASCISIALINIIRGAYVRYKFQLRLFNVKIAYQLLFFLLGLSLITLLKVQNHLMGVLLNNLIIILLFVLPVIGFKLSPDINEWLQKLKNKLK